MEAKKYELNGGTTVEVKSDGRGRSYVLIADGSYVFSSPSEELTEVQIPTEDLATLGAILSSLAVKKARTE